MKDWNFKVKNSPEEVSRKLESSLGKANRFVLNMKYDRINPVRFKIRKRLLLAFQINTQNNIIVNGRISKKPTARETDIEVAFTQHPLSKILMYGHIVLGLGFLAAILLELSNNSYTYILAGLLLTVGILSGIHLKRSFDKHVQEYKKLISEILDIP